MSGMGGDKEALVALLAAQQQQQQQFFAASAGGMSAASLPDQLLKAAMGGGMAAGMGPMGGMGNSLPPDFRPGDWMCTFCGKHNFANKMACFGCGRPKQGGMPGMGMGMPGMGMLGMQQAPPDFRPGDWMCQQCNAHNFASKTRCHKCGWDPQSGVKGADGADGAAGAMAGMGGVGAAGNLVGKDLRPGDWICSNCNAHNFASKQACFKCGIGTPTAENTI